MRCAPKRRPLGRVDPQDRAVVVRLVRQSSAAVAARALGTHRLMVEQATGDSAVRERTAELVGERVEALLARYASAAVSEP